MVFASFPGQLTGPVIYFTFGLAEDHRAGYRPVKAGNAINGKRVHQCFGIDDTQVVALAGAHNLDVFAGPGLLLTPVEGCATREIHYEVASDGYEHIVHITPGIRPNGRHVEQAVGQLKGIVHPGQIVVITGSLPETVGPEVVAELIRWLRQLGAFVILDARPELLAAIVGDPECHPHFLKANWEEWRGLIPGRNRPRIGDISRETQRLFPNTIVAVSLGSLGVVVKLDGDIYRLKCDPEGLMVATRIGCGDSWVAAFAKFLLEGLSFLECFIRAVAAATANLTTATPGEIPLDRFAEYLSQVRYTKFRSRAAAPRGIQVRLRTLIPA